MKTTAILFAADVLLFAVRACNTLDLNTMVPRVLTETRISPAARDTIPQETKDIYVTAISYPRSFDWRNDSTYNAAECDILLFKNNVLIKSFSAGNDNEIGKDADMHHFFQGHLYTEFCSATETVIKKDGEDMIRFNGREYIRGLFCSGNSLYTLCQDRKGEGLSFRKDGRPVLISDRGIILRDMFDYSSFPGGALYEDNGVICFCFLEGDTLCAVIDGKQSSSSLPKGTVRVFDARIMNGSIYLICELQGKQSVFLFKDGEMQKEIEVPLGRASNDYMLAFFDGEPGVYGTFGIGEGISSPFTTVWLADGGDTTLPGKAEIYSFGYNLAFVTTGYEAAVMAYSPRLGYFFSDDNYYMFSSLCASWDDGHARLALTPFESSLYPILVTDEKREEYKINGFLTGVYAF